MTQDTHLSDYIKNNLRIAKLDATDDRLSGMQEGFNSQYISTLLGYDTPVAGLATHFLASASTCTRFLA